MMYMLTMALLWSTQLLEVVGQDSAGDSMCSYNVIIPQKNITQRCEALAEKEAQTLRKRSDIYFLFIDD